MNPAARGMLLLPCLLFAGCASAPRAFVPATAPRLPEGQLQGVVYCAPGAGGYGGTTEVVAQVVREANLPLQVEVIPWTHGPGRMIADHLDTGNLKAQAVRLAQTLRRQRELHPGWRTYLMAHSDGCAVILDAAATLPADSIDG